MPDDRVEIIYQASARGAEQIKDLANKTAELEKATDKASTATARVAQAQEKQTSAMLKARHAIQSFKKELFALTFAIGLIRGLSASSDELAERFEKLGKATAKALQPLGNMIARLFGGKGELSDVKKIELLGMQEDIARLRGDSAEALRRKMESEEIKFNNSIRSLSDDKKRIFRAEFEERKKLLTEQQRLEELGLKRQREIFNDFKKDLVGGFRGATGESLFNLFEGNPQSGGDVLQGFRTAISRALSDALSQSAFTSLLSGGSGGLSGFFSNFKNILTGKNSTTAAIDKSTESIKGMHQTLLRATDCICRTAENTAAMAYNGRAAIEGTITPASSQWFQKVGSISSLVGAVAGAGAYGGGGFGGAGNVADPNALPAWAGVTNGMGPLMHSGGYVRAYSAGGEVPITAQGGEFVVRKSVAMRNKEFLTDFNMHGDTKKSKMGGGGNVFLIKANDAQSFDQMLASPSARQRMEMQLIRSIMSNGSSRKVIKEFTR